MSRDVLDKFDRIAHGYSEHDYADPARYAARRAKMIVELGPRLEPGRDRARPRLRRRDHGRARSPRYGLATRGVDASEGMVDAARVRNPASRSRSRAARSTTPPEPVDATICLRSFYYPADRQAFFRRVAGLHAREVRLRLPAARASGGAGRRRPARGRVHADRAAAVLPAAAPARCPARSFRSSTRSSARARSRRSSRAATGGCSAPPRSERAQL